MTDIKRWISRRSKELAANITPEQLFNSPEFSEHVNNIASTVLGNRYNVSVKLENAGEEGESGFTNGDMIWLNTCNRIANFYNILESKFAAFIGIVLHECAHIKFHNFASEKLEFEKLENGQFPGEPPESEDEEEQAVIEEVSAAIAEPSYRKVFHMIYDYLANVVDDVHDEWKMTDQFGGYVQECLTFSAEAIRGRCHSLEKMEELEKKGKMSSLSIAFSVILQFLRYSSVLSVDENSEYASKYLKTLYQYSRHAHLARWTDDQAEKMTHINYVVLSLWPFIKEELEKQKEDGQQGQSGGSAQNSSSQHPQNGPSQPLTQNQLQNLLSQLQQGANNAGTTPKPQNRKASPESKKQKGNGVNNAQAHGAQETKPAVQPAHSSQNTTTSSTVAAMMQQVAGNMAQSVAEEEAEKQISSEVNEEVNVPSENTHHKGIPVDVRRNLNVYQSDIDEYEKQMKDLKMYSKTIQRQILELFREISEGEISKHRLFGNRFNAGDAYRVDQRMFSNKKQPQETPNMAIAILVDCSGSMDGERLKTAKKAAMLLHDFADGLSIPVMVAGHNTRGKTVVYTLVATFDKATNKDKYRIAKLEANGSNRDGLAIEKTINLLAKRPEEMKMFFIISDGQPAHHGYGGEEAQKDIQAIVAKGKRSGVETFAAAIGSDKEKIEAIYKEGFLDIDDLSKLPKILTKLVRKRLFR